MAKQGGLITIEVLNWERFNERKDVKHSSWFRLEHSLGFDPEWAHFDAEEKWLWIFILCTASMKNRGTIAVSEKTLVNGAGVSAEKVSSCLQKLKDKKAVRIRNGDATSSQRIRSATNERTNKTNEQGDALDFEAVWQKYPRKVNKTEARTRFLRLIKTPEDFADLARAIDAYAAHCVREKTEPKYVKHMSSFIGVENAQPWRDWLAPEMAPQPLKVRTLDEVLRGV